MDTERPARIEALFHAALARPPADRAAFLGAECAGDEALQREVESLLARASSGADFLTAPIGRGQAASIVGHQLGIYLINARIGAGAMGEVYQARDTRLGREVAIKVLPAAFAEDRDRLARFEREARSLASLNHPNIASIYGLEEIDGCRFLVLELVPGETLAEAIRARGPASKLTVPTALGIAGQIADALEAAHERGIIHRDLKPANVKLTPLGQVKVLDFGLAKNLGGTAAGDDATGTGLIVGTPAYMSPEQARGHAVDARTDIWAFGCVLYEVLSRKRAFEGETVSDTLAHVLERTPDWDALPDATPSEVRRLLTRCLDKNPRRRLHDIADARIEIEDALSGASPAATIEAVNRRPTRGRLPWSVAAAASVIAIAALAWDVVKTPHAPSAAMPVSRLMVAAQGTAGVALSGGHGVAITPDGTRIVYVGNNGRQLFVRPLDRLDATDLFTSVAPVNGVSVSPDGQWVAFVDGAVLKKIAITGGPPATIAQPVGAVAWTPDDTFIVAKPAGLERVSAEGATLKVLTRCAPERGEAFHVWPEMLPGGRAVLFTIVAMTGGLETAQVAVLDLATGASRVLVRGGSDARYVSSGHLVYLAGGRLDAMPFDLARLETYGTAVTVLPRLATAPRGAGQFAASVNGTLVYLDTSDAAAEPRTLVWVDRQGREEPLGAPPRRYLHPRLSPDGTRVAVVIADQEYHIWIWDLARRTLSQRTFDRAVDFFPVWTPDGRRLVFASEAPTGSVLLSQRADGTGTAEPITGGSPSGDAGLPSGVTPDGARLLFQTNAGNRELMMLALDGTHPAEPLLTTPFNERNGVVSPDGRWLAYESDSSGRFEIYVRPFPKTSTGQWSISTAGGTRPVWAAGGRELFYEAPSGAIMSVRVDPRGAVWNAGDPLTVVERRYFTQAGGNRNYDVFPDGRRLLMIKQPVDQPAPQMIVVQQWFEELKRLVPSK